MPELTREGVRIHYEVEGVGPPVVLHTGGAGDLRMWRLAGYTGGLAPFRRILIDHRGRGASDRPGAPAAHRIEEFRDDVIALLDEVGEERAAFLGYSFGALVGCALASVRPDRVAALVALDGLEGEDRSCPAAAAELRALADSVRRTGLAAKVRVWALAEGFEAPDWFNENLVGTDSGMFALSIEASTKWDGPARLLPHLRVPVLCLR